MTIKKLQQEVQDWLKSLTPKEIKKEKREFEHTPDYPLPGGFTASDAENIARDWQKTNADLEKSMRDFVERKKHD